MEFLFKINRNRRYTMSTWLVLQQWRGNWGGWQYHHQHEWLKWLHSGSKQYRRSKKDILLKSSIFRRWPNYSGRWCRCLWNQCLTKAPRNWRRKRIHFLHYSIFGGKGERPLSNHTGWSYALDFKSWCMHSQLNPVLLSWRTASFTQQHS